MNLPVKKRYSAEEKTLYVSQWKTSGQSKISFAQENGLKYDTFLHWLQREKAVSKEKPVCAAEQSNPSFVSIQVDHTAVAKASIPLMEITLSNGSHISFYQPIPVDYLRDLLK